MHSRVLSKLFFRDGQSFTKKWPYYYFVMAKAEIRFRPSINHPRVIHIYFLG